MKYVVKGTHVDEEWPRWVRLEPDGDHVVVDRRADCTAFTELSAAIQAWCDAQLMTREPRIFAIADDGAETPLHTYEEALAELEHLRAHVRSVSMREGVTPRNHSTLPPAT